MPTDKAGQIIYPVDNGEPLANDTEHLDWITFLKNGLDDYFVGRNDVFVAADLLWYPVKDRPDVSKAPDVMVVLNHPAGPRMSYKQWEENDRPPQVVFEFMSSSNTAGEMMDKLDFYSEAGCEEFYIFDYQRDTLRAYLRETPGKPLVKTGPDSKGFWHSPLLDLTFGLDAQGDLWVLRPDGKLMETQREIWARAEAERLRAEAESIRAETERLRAEKERLRAESEGLRANKLAAKLRELGIDPDSI